MTRISRLSVVALVVCAGSATALARGVFTGPTSSQSPYLVPVSGGPAVDVYSIISVGDSVNNKPDGSPYRMVGIPDGLGAYDNNDGTMTIVMNHELGATSGIARAHGGTGSFISQWVINKSNLAALNGRDLNTSYVTTTNGPAGSGSTANSFTRFCSGDLALGSAYYNAGSGLGSQQRIYLTGEENGGGSRAIASVLDSARTGVQLNAWNNLNIGFENLLANPFAQDKTIVNANSDGGDNRVFTYIGSKTSSGSELDKAGLTNGTAYGIQVKIPNGSGGFTNVAAENRNSGFATSGGAVLSGRFDLTQGAGTTFLRPEDGAWDPSSPNKYYFVTTDRLDTTDGGTGAGAGQIGRSRLWEMSYDDITNPQAGGTIRAILDGTEGQNMLDNMCVVPGLDGHLRVLAQEDTGGASHNAKVWMIDVTTGERQIVLQHDAARFGDVGVSPTAPYTVDEESSGIIDARDTLGLGWFLLDVQAHYGISGELAEGGQLLAVYIPSAIPAPASAGVLGLAGLVALRRRR